MPDLPPAEISDVFRREYGRAVAVLVRRFGDIDLAEEAVQDAFVTAVDRWPRTGPPPSPAGWIITTASNRAIDRLRRRLSARTGTPKRPGCVPPPTMRGPTRHGLARRAPATQVAATRELGTRELATFRLGRDLCKTTGSG